MKAGSITPGSIVKAGPLTPEFLLGQWSSEMVHSSASLNLHQLAFSAADWASWEWNAREAIHLNSKGGTLYAGLRLLHITQSRINFHLLHAYRNLISGWRQCEKLNHYTDLAGEAGASGTSFLLVSALGRLEQAEVKNSSMQNQKHKVMQAASVRQLRYFQQLTALLVDLNPLIAAEDLVTGLPAEAAARLAQTRGDILWHVKELLRLLGPLENQPGLIQRLRIPRVAANRLLGNACLYHALHLKTMLGESD